MASRMYNRGMFEIINQTTNWTSADLRIILVDETHTFDPDDNFVTDIVAEEISTSGYARQAMDSGTITENDTDDTVDLDAADEVWTALGPASGGPTVAAAIIYRYVGGVDATSPLIVFGDLTNTDVNGGDLTINWPVGGICNASSP